jgi:plasmid stabilization system protein ParE
MDMMAERTLRWHPKASTDLNRIVWYCSQKFGKSTARQVRNHIWHDAELLQSYPQLGQVEPLLAGCTSLEYRSLVVDKVTKIIYTVHREYVYIHLLWDVRRDEDFLPQATMRRYQDFESEPIWASEPPIEYGNPEDLGE